MTVSSAFAELFDGYQDAHGEFTIRGRSASGKVTGQAITKKGPADLALHLEGKASLGVVPLREDDSVLFSALDIDNYNVKIRDLAKEVKRRELPLVLCESKSGGIHAYLFLVRPHKAEEVRNVLQTWSRMLGFAGCEIFPKQNYRARDPDGTTKDIGNWINLPYYSSKERRCFHNGGWLSLAEFIDHAKQSRYDLQDFRAPESKDVDPLFKGAPPCLCHFSQEPDGVPEGHKHNHILILVIYCKKRWPDEWETKVIELIPKIMRTTVGWDNLKKKIDNMGKSGKDYELKCEGPWCDGKQCRKAQFGRGGGGMLVDITNITKLVGDPTMWAIDLDGDRLLCETHQLYNQHQFNQRCMEVISRCPATMRQGLWNAYLDQRMQNCDEIHAPVEATTKGQFIQLIWQFCETTYHRATDVVEVTIGKVYADDNFYYFTGHGLFEHLKDKGFSYRNKNMIWNWVKELGAKETTKRDADKKQYKVWKLPVQQ